MRCGRVTRRRTGVRCGGVTRRFRVRCDTRRRAGNRCGVATKGRTGV